MRGKKLSLYSESGVAIVAVDNYYNDIVLQTAPKGVPLFENSYIKYNSCFAWNDNGYVYSFLPSGVTFYNDSQFNKATMSFEIDVSAKTFTIKKLDSSSSRVFSLDFENSVFQLGINVDGDDQYLQVFNYKMKSYRNDERYYISEGFEVDHALVDGDIGVYDAYREWVLLHPTCRCDGAYISSGRGNPLTFFYYNGTSKLTNRTWGHLCYSGIGEQYTNGLLISDIDSKISDDPYDDGENNDPDGNYDGGDGDGDNTSDTIPEPDLPSKSVIDTGFVTLYNPTESQLNRMANYMWSGLFDLDTLKKLIDDPMDYIIGLNLLPIEPTTSGSREIAIGNISLSGVSMPVINEQWYRFDMGSVHCPTDINSYLDYAPYTKVSIYLPFIGTQELYTDDVMGKDIHLTYHIDIFTGACMAYIMVGGSVLYEFAGQCSSSIPFTGKNYNEVIGNVITAVGAIGATVATMGAGAPAVGAGVAGAGAVAGATETAGTTAMIESAGRALGASADAVISSKPDIRRSGSCSGVSGLLGCLTPYILLEKPQRCEPAYQNSLMGYPSFKGLTIGSSSGFTTATNVELKTSATQSENNEIRALLESGVFV